MRSSTLLLAALLVACGGKDDSETGTAVTDADGDGFSAENDCDDGDASVNPDATERWYDGVDQDCDGADDYDQDGDGVRGDEGGLDCDDTNADVYAGNVERCDGLDNDCDQQADEDPVDASERFLDADGDGWGDGPSLGASCEAADGTANVTGDCDDADAEVHPDAEERCDEVDNDCSGRVDDNATDAADWHVDLDGDGFGSEDSIARACAQPEGWVADATDCDDADPASFPEAPELCDTRDNDCDGRVDDGATDARTWYADVDADGYGAPGSTLVSCEQPAGYAATADDCDDAQSVVRPGAAEWCDGIDNDCSGASDDDALDAATYHPDVDADGFGSADSAVVSCNAIPGWVEDGTDCDDADANSRPGGTEVCGGGDEDCDGSFDESDAAESDPYYLDADGDGYGVPTAVTRSCTQPRGYARVANDCDDSLAAVSPGARERCDSLDNDCDGSVDEEDAYDIRTWYADGDGDGYGGESGSFVGCSAPAGFVGNVDDCDDSAPLISPDGTETRDLVDEDCDGMVDEGFIGAGDIVITEVARQPYVGGSGTATSPNSQWFEVYNPTATAIDMSGWYVEENDGDFFYIAPEGDLVVPPGGYRVLCYGASGFATAASCDYTWGSSSYGLSDVGLPHYDTTYYFNRDEDLVALYLDGSLIDSVYWSLTAVGGVSWPRTAHYAMRLDDNRLNATDNDLPASWCLAPVSQVYTAPGVRGGPDYGTPRAANGSCD